MENAPRYKVGDLVSVAKWDATQRPENRIRSPARVVQVNREVCQTGFMLYVEGPTHKAGYLDQDWVTPWVSPMEGVQP